MLRLLIDLILRLLPLLLMLLQLMVMVVERPGSLHSGRRQRVFQLQSVQFLGK